MLDTPKRNQDQEEVGELGFLAPDNRRTQTLACAADGDVLAISYDDLRQLFFQNPAFGFYFLRLTTGRLFDNLGRLEDQVATLNGGSPAAQTEAPSP